MCVMSTILLESQTPAQFKHTVRNYILKNRIKSFNKFSLFRYLVEERGQRAGVDVDHRGGGRGCCVVVAVDARHLLLFLPEVQQRLVGRQ